MYQFSWGRTKNNYSNYSSNYNSNWVITGFVFKVNQEWLKVVSMTIHRYLWTNDFYQLLICSLVILTITMLCYQFPNRKPWMGQYGHHKESIWFSPTNTSSYILIQFINKQNIFVKQQKTKFFRVSKDKALLTSWFKVITKEHGL